MAPLYDYKAFSPAGKPEKGMIEADSAKTARQRLKKQGLMVTSIVEKSTRKGKSSSGGGLPFVGGRVKQRDVTLMTRQLASLVKANIPLVEALKALVDQTENEKLKVVLDKVNEDVKAGSSLSKAMSAHPRVFDTIFINMVEAGESSGTLGLVLLRLADLKEAQLRLRGKIVSGMTYPAIMLIVAVVLMFGIFGFVIPKLTKVFEEMNKPMPDMTKFLIWVSDAVNTYWWALLAGAIFSLLFFRRWIDTEKGRARWDAFKLHAPVFGSLARMIAVTRFASTMATLLGSGVPILIGMRIAKNLVGNTLIAQAIENARSNITEGQSIADPLRRSGEFPPLVTHMIAIGEKTGELPDMLKTISTSYEEQVTARIEGLTSMLEPLMIIFMGGMVGFIVFAIFVPLLEISNIK